MSTELIFVAIGGMAIIGIIFWIVVANRKTEAPSVVTPDIEAIRKEYEKRTQPPTPPVPPVNPGR